MYLEVMAVYIIYYILLPCYKLNVICHLLFPRLHIAWVRNKTSLIALCYSELVEGCLIGEIGIPPILGVHSAEMPQRHRMNADRRPSWCQ